MNPGVILLICLGVILLITAILVITWAAISFNNNNVPGPLPQCSQNVNINSLIQIPDTGYNCVQHGQTGSLYYVGQLGNLDYDYVVAPYKTPIQDVCIGFCSIGFTGGVCMGPNYNGKTAQTNYDNCIAQLSSTTCIPPIPIAAKGTTIYYPLLPTCCACEKTPTVNCNCTG